MPDGTKPTSTNPNPNGKSGAPDYAGNRTPDKKKVSNDDKPKKGTEGHHTLPKEILKELPEEVAKNPLVKGAKGKPNIKQIPTGKHKEIHKGKGGGDYNERFKEEIEKKGGYKQVSPEEVDGIRKKLIEEFGI